MLHKSIVHNIVSGMTPIYTTTVHATGDGRNGHVSSDDGIIELPVLMPKELGGAGGATNPEQLFAAGYAACFHSALRLVAGQAGIDTTDSAVSATVHLGSTDTGGFGIGVELDVSLPNATPEQAQSAVENAHAVCPYSNATRNNIDVKLSIV
jgi:Ohr subfamily peroxiredoxin